MLNSQFEYLRPLNQIILCAGHGGTDPGAVFNNDIEAKDNIFTTAKIAENLKAMGLNVMVVSDDLDLVGAINYVNSKFQWGQAWALEIHRDSASGLTANVANNRVGVYGFGQYTGQDGKFYNEDVRSMDIARFMRDKMVQRGAEPSSWARPDSVATYGRLGWIRDTKPAAHLIELGFVQGRSDSEHLTWLAGLASIAIYEAFTGNPAPNVGSSNSSTNNTPIVNNSLSTDDYAIKVLRNYTDLPLNIPGLENLWKEQQHQDQALDQILASFRKNITELKIVVVQRDQTIAQRDQVIINLQNNPSRPSNSSQVQQLQTDLTVSNQQRENYRQQLATLLSSYDQLQTDFANYKRGANGGVSGQVSPLSAITGENLSSANNSFSRLSYVSNPNSNGLNLNPGNSNPVVPVPSITTPGGMVINSMGIANAENSSNKPFWKSKKFGASLLNTVSSIALITWQTAQIKPEDSLSVIATKLGTALVGVLGISFVSNQYIKVQGKVDEASFGQISSSLLKQILNR